MRPAQKAPENLDPKHVERLDRHASMRPAQKAPENRAGSTASGRGSCCFNEAGAKSAGKLEKTKEFRLIDRWLQ